MICKKAIIILLILPLFCLAQNWKSHSILSSGNWHKIAISETGVYKITPADINALEGCNVNNISLYSGNALQMDEDNSTIETDDLIPYVIQVVDNNNNGRMDGNDFILFFGEGVTTWRYDSNIAHYVHQRHSYSNYNYYFLRTDSPNSRTIPTQTNLTANQSDITQFTLCAVYEKELYNTHNSGQIWAGEKFLNGTTKSISAPFEQSVTYPIYTRIALAIPDAMGRFTITNDNSSSEFTLNSNEDYKVFQYNYPSPNFSFTFNASGSTAGYLDFIEMSCLATPQMDGSNNRLIHNQQYIGNGNIARHIINGTNINVWDVTQRDSCIRMATQNQGSTTCFINHTDIARDYYLFQNTRTPDKIISLPNQNIHGASTPDMVIVCHKDYVNQSQRIANIHNIEDGMDVLVVTQDAVFNEFSGGKKDPIAIREMMRMFYTREEGKTKYLLLFGKGTYDNRDILENNITSVVTYQSPTSFTDYSGNSGSDDIYGYLGPNETATDGDQDISIGRLPAKNENEANLLAQKVENYLMRVDLQQNDASGDWRTYVSLLSDDADPSQQGDIDFVTSSEYLSDRIELQNNWINLDKIYADAYQQQSGTIGSYYPDVNNALKRRMDNGCLLLNYIGHGSELYIGTERYMDLTDIDNFKNFDRLPFFVTSTCSFGKFDKIDGLCGSEAFVLAKGAGIGCVAAARPISHLRTFNSTLVLNSLKPENTIGDALRIAKNTYRSSQNVAITLMGDPALKLSFPKYNVVVSKINGNPIAEGITDSAEVLSRVTVEGEIQNRQGILQHDFNGTIYPIVFDRKSNCRTLANDNPGTEIDFTLQKSILYKGRDTVIGGRFSYTFVVPRDVDYRYDFARLSHYAKSMEQGVDAAGAYTNLMLGGFDENADISETRPEIRLFIGDTNFINGGLADENATLIAVLHDTVGINSVGSGLGHDITAILDDNANDVIILNDFYEADVTRPDWGMLRYQFENLTPGSHTLTVKAWNIYNYSASATVNFIVKGSDTASIGSFKAYPNPATSYVMLHVGHNCKDGITDARIEIFNLQGKRIRSFSPNPAEGSYSLGPIRWNLDNESGNRVPDGIYLTRVILNTEEGKTLTSSTKIVLKK